MLLNVDWQRKMNLWIKQILLLIFIISCGEKVETSEITSNLILYITEEYPDNKISTPVLKVSLETEAYYECANYSLITRSFELNTLLRIDVIGASIGDICLTAFGPATKSLELEEHVERLAIVKNGVVDEYLIEITKEVVLVQPMNSGFSSFNYSEYYRYPENSFAFLCGTLREDSLVCKQFEQILLDNLQVEKFTFPLDGKPPYPESAEGHWYDAPASYFKYQDSNDLATAGSLLKSFYSTELIGKSGIGLTIIGWNNTQFRNDKQLN